MFRVGICDDDIKFAEEFEGYILKYAAQREISADTQIFTDEQDLYRCIQTEGAFDLLFLDIELNHTTGIEIGKRLRSDLKNEVMQIVFISIKESYAMQLFDIRPMNFLVKPVKYEKLAYIMDEYNRLYRFRQNYFEYQVGKKKYGINEQLILYFQSQGKKIIMVTLEGEREFYGKLSDVIEQLNSSCFCAVHKSYVIHLGYVAEYSKDNVHMANGDIIPVSRAMRNHLNRKLVENRWGKDGK